MGLGLSGVTNMSNGTSMVKSGGLGKVFGGSGGVLGCLAA